jgi:hypothetical protein
MEHFLAERYVGLADAGALQDDDERVRTAADAAGTVRLVQTFYVPDDETCFHLFEGESAAEVTKVGELAELNVSRVLWAVAVGEAP